MAPKWSREAIEALICAYKEEHCLYMVKSANYYNRYLRSEALKRVANAVSLVRPNTTSNDCYVKMHGLRNQFNVELWKVKSSKSNGTALGDEYVPSLWYYDKLLFLAQHTASRKSQCLDQESDTSTTASEDACSQSATMAQYSVEVTSNVDIEINPICKIEHSESLSTLSLAPVPVPFTPVPGPSAPVPGPSAATTEIESGRPLLPSALETPSSRKRSADSHLSAVEVIATQEQYVAASVVDNFVAFISSYMKEIKSPTIKMQLMSDIHKLVMEAKMKDFQQE